jgi:polar amino acid transport system substrate-binding protein
MYIDINHCGIDMSKPTRRSIFKAICLLALGLLLPAQSSAEDLQIFTEEYPPVSFSKSGQAAGFGSEVVAEIQRRVGSHAQIHVVPWARGYQMVLQNKNVALFATMRTDEREHLFKWVGPLTTVKTSFYARRESAVQIKNMADAKALDPILVPRQYYSQQYLQSAGFPNLEQVDTPEMMVHMLLAGRRSTMVTDNLTLGALLEKAGAARPDVRPLYTFLESQNYIAFSHNTPDALVQQWQSALDDMKRDGSFAKLYETWLPGETPPGISPSANIEISH